MTAPTFVIVLPAIDPQLTDACIGSMDPRLRERTLLIDNTETRDIVRDQARRGLLAYDTPGTNLGVSVSWNRGIALADSLGCDYLVLLSQSISFGAPGGTDFLDQLNARRPQVIMHSQHGWKFLALARMTWETVGRFDPIFSPGYREDVDYLRRMFLAGLPSPLYNDGRLDQIVIDADSAGDAQAIKRGRVQIDFPANTAVWMRKWNGEICAETFATPYDDPALDYTFTGPYVPESIPSPDQEIA